MVKCGPEGCARCWVFRITVPSSCLRDCVWTVLMENRKKAVRRTMTVKEGNGGKVST
jgi:hypothetical protein